MLYVASGRTPFFETIVPVRESVLVNIGSKVVSIEILVPGITSFTVSLPLCKDNTFVVNGS